MDAHARSLLEAGAAELGIALDATQIERMLTLLDLVVEWNQKFNLTAITEPVAMVQKHLLDSLTVQRWIGGPFVTDIGTGAGFPGLPLAIVNPTMRFTLIDSTAKKIRFVEHAVQELGLEQVTAVCSRAEAWKPSQRSLTVVSRALGSIPDFVRNAGHLVAHSGRLLAMKGKDPIAELDDLPPGWIAKGIERLHVPGLADERHLVIIERVPRI
ncbi:MAG: 16S rRNA (guanine(527)-N(7))-methyltransferase RsmG [Pseudomonadota bacterium]